MKCPCVAVAAILVASISLADENVKALFDGTEISLNIIKADPKKYFGKPFSMVGQIEIDDYYNFAYFNAQDEFYSLRFRQVLLAKDGVTGRRGEMAHLYLKKDDVGKSIIDAILELGDESKPFVRVLAGEGRIQNDAPQVAWEMLELVDLQFFSEKKWQPWLRESHGDRVKQAQAEAAELKDQERKAAQAAKAAQQAKLDEAKWRTWTSRDGSKKLEAKFVKVIGDKLTLLKRDGSTVNTSLAKFSDADALWIKRRGWTK